MKTAHRSFVRTPLVGVFLVFLCLTFITTTNAAVTPSLGLASTFGVLSDTFTSTGASSTVYGDVGYTTTSGAYTVSGGTDYGSSAPYAQAGNDQAVALATLDSELCTFTFSAGAVDLATDTTHGLIGIYTPGVYCITGAMSVGTHGIVLNGNGTYIFRSSGALTTVDNSVVSASGVSSCDIFWTPNGATTLGANTTFVGTVIPVSQDITIGTLTSWLGQALTFGHTVTIDTSSIHSACTIGSAPIPTGILSVINQVVNTGGGTAVASDFQMHVMQAGSDVAGSPDIGIVSPGRAYTLIAPATYTVSQDANVLYTQSFSGDCDLHGIVALISNGTSVCTLINTYIIPVVTPPVVTHNAGHPSFPIVITPPIIGVVPQVIVPVVPQVIPSVPATSGTPNVSISNTNPPYQIPHFPNTGIAPDESQAWFENLFSFFVTPFSYVEAHTQHATTSLSTELLIPAIHLDTQIESVGVTSTSALDVPQNFAHIGWFDGGPRPGEHGNAVLDGHYGWKNGVPAIFNLIHTLHRGDTISTVDENGHTIVFRVRETKTYDASMNAREIFVSSDTAPHLVLVTCSGEWVHLLHTYTSRLAVFADEVAGEAH